MSTKVYVFRCRLDDAARAIVESEIERGRRYYNDMIADLNSDIAGTKEHEGEPAIEGKARRIEHLARHICTSDDKANTVAARAIYRRIARVSLNIRALPKFSAFRSGCYTGTYHGVQAAFDQATSAKRVGVWPGEPFRYRRHGDNSGTGVGVHIQPATTWANILSGRHSICKAERHPDGRVFFLDLKVSKESGPIGIRVILPKRCHGVRREIPSEGTVSHVLIHRTGDYGTRGKYELHVTVKTPSANAPPVEVTRVGVDIGWRARSDGSLLVAVTSDGQECSIPAYAVRMALRESELQSERDNLANELRARHPECTGSSAIGVASWVQRNCDQSEAEYLAKEHALRCTQDHVRRRYLAIRTDVYRKFAAAIGWSAAVLKTRLKEVAEEELKGQPENFDRKLAAGFQLAQLLRNAGAAEVVCERRGDSNAPERENAEQIRVAHETGKLLDRGARRSVRKYRRTKRAA